MKTSKKHYSLLLFDADGTLFDYERGERSSLDRTLSAYAVEPSDAIRVTYKGINGKLWKAFERGEVTIPQIRTERFRALFEQLGVTADPSEAGELYLSFLGESGFLLDGTLKLLETLSKGYELALITNGITDTQYGRLDASGIRSYFDPIIISDEVGVQKPDPGIFELLFDKAGNPDKREALIIGDSLTSDMQGGINFGIDTCWYNPEKRERRPPLPVTHEISSFAELILLLS